MWVNVHDRIYIDPRYIQLVIKCGDRFKALGMLTVAWELAQRHFLKSETRNIPMAEWIKLGLGRDIIDVGLAKVVDGEVQVAGRDEYCAVLLKYQKAGQKSAEMRRQNAKVSKCLDGKDPSLKTQPTLTNVDQPCLKTQGTCTNNNYKYKEEVLSMCLEPSEPNGSSVEDISTKRISESEIGNPPSPAVLNKRPPRRPRGAPPPSPFPLHLIAEAYPRRMGTLNKYQALKILAERIKTPAEFEEHLMATKEYFTQCELSKTIGTSYVSMMTSFFNNDVWKEYLDAAKARNFNSKPPSLPAIEKIPDDEDPRTPEELQADLEEFMKGKKTAHAG